MYIYTVYDFEYSGPTLIDLNFLKPGETIKKIKCGFDQCAVFTGFL